MVWHQRQTAYMEENAEAKQIHQLQQQTEEEVQDKEDKVNQAEENREGDPESHDETKSIAMLEENPLPEESTKEPKHENETKIGIDNKHMPAETVGENQADTRKKTKQAPRPIPKMKTTVAKPFSLATEKRMSRDRRASMDLFPVTEKKVVKERHASVDYKELQPPKLSKSASLNFKATSSLNARDLQASKLKRSDTSTSLRPIVTSTKREDKKVENGVRTREKTPPKEIQSNSVPIPKKRQAAESETEKLQKSSTFKALPLPSFNRRKESTSKSEVKKIPVNRPKSPSLGSQRNKPTSEAEKSKPKATSTSKRSIPRAISRGAKDTISKLIKGTQKALNASKGTAKSVVSSA